MEERLEIGRYELDASGLRVNTARQGKASKMRVFTQLEKFWSIMTSFKDE
jgi:hypothetical protein